MSPYRAFCRRIRRKQIFSFFAFGPWRPGHTVVCPPAAFGRDRKRATHLRAEEAWHEEVPYVASNPVGRRRCLCCGAAPVHGSWGRRPGQNEYGPYRPHLERPGRPETTDDAIQGMAFLPRTIWVNVGDRITWTAKAGEIHTVTFLAKGHALTPFDPSDPTMLFRQGSRHYDGVSYYNSGIMTDEPDSGFRLRAPTPSPSTRRAPSPTGASSTER